MSNEAGGVKTAQSDSEDDRNKQMVLAKATPQLKSTAVVKYIGTELPIMFNRLQRNTDLNRPPTNWLHGNSTWDSHLRDFSLGKRDQFSSFKMAHTYPDLTGDIDVVADSEVNTIIDNIKKLLKMPYSKSSISMMVHRVGNTLLLDDFDVHQHLLRQQQDNWVWLRKFYYATVVHGMQSGEKCIVKKNKSRDQLQNRNLFSKFLYYSLANKGKEEEEQNFVQRSSREKMTKARLDLPDPLPRPETNVDNAHQRELVWTFEDIRMLIGTDLPIFGGGKRPCVSLRLRDMQKPINVLTGLDYWLDNLMCNVPELAMCYHLDGIVQSYELIKTEDIPTMDQCNFSPQVVKDIAQNILSFLKSNATKEGHTYWLFKGHGDEVVKLYDLSTLCSDVVSEPQMNPFTIPVGILLYRVARNMRESSGWKKRSATIRTLLENALRLLQPQKHSQIVTSAHFLLSDVYVPNEEDINFDGEDSDDEEYKPSKADEERKKKAENSTSDSSSTIAVQSLCDSKEDGEREREEISVHPPITGEQSDRCCEALKHIAKGLTCLDDNIQDVIDAKEAGESKQTFCNPSVAIPLHYSSLNQAEMKQSEKSDQSSMWKNRGLTQTWHLLSKTLLLKKAAMAYQGLANARMKKNEINYVAQYILRGLTCYVAMVELSDGKEDPFLLASLEVLLGDLHCYLAQLKMQKILPTSMVGSAKLDQFEATEEDELIAASVKKAIGNRTGSERHYPTAIDVDYDIPVRADLSRSLYAAAEVQLKDLPPSQSITEKLTELTKRLGLVHNEKGRYYMAILVKSDAQNNGRIDPKHADSCAKKCEDSLQTALGFWKKVNDKRNQPLILCNLGRLHKIMAEFYKAHATVDGVRGEFTPKERLHFTKSADFYQQALTFLGDRKSCSEVEVWDNIAWDLSSTLFEMASQMQEHAPLSTISQEEVEKDVVMTFERALRICEVHENSAKAVLNAYRAASIHHRLASLNHNVFRNQTNENARKYAKKSAEEHYVKCTQLFAAQDATVELLRVTLERLSLCETVLKEQTSPVRRSQTLVQSLHLAFTCIRPLSLLLEEKATDEPNEEERVAQKAKMDEATRMAFFLNGRMQTVLLELNKTSQKRKSKIEISSETAKALYIRALRDSLAMQDTGNDNRLQLMHSMLQDLKRIFTDSK
ncbi:hypothetical protein CAPTEDRAFT_225050 [Capitella teleta]|uniref:Erythroid differentiation-related factor 1 n=1 Tax=Capitella teleta TaxID=283909 RepID=R7U2F5_CAPTE|nr:hypothetical protein CAPTEDRAFT_225050 [Capitella teleta]|eukprot:ELT97340.1 hypothetical protein CAPTEDRAFT_225050 [Capitella teleta]